MLAQVLEVDNKGAEVLVHFAGWNGRHDDWIKMDSPRLQPYTRRSSRRRQSTGDNSGSEGESRCRLFSRQGLYCVPFQIDSITVEEKTFL